MNCELRASGLGGEEGSLFEGTVVRKDSSGVNITEAL